MKKYFTTPSVDVNLAHTLLSCFEHACITRPYQLFFTPKNHVTHVMTCIYKSSYYNSTVSSIPASAIRHTEILSRSEGSFGYGLDIEGGKTADLLLYLQGRFGPVTSFSGSYSADRWELNIHRTSGVCL